MNNNFDIDDIVGKKFGRLTVLKFDHKKLSSSKNGNKKNFTYYYLCRCVCGKKCTVERFHLKYGHTQSCGCLQKERTSKASKKHGMEKTRLYHIWQGIKRRCLNQNDGSYKKYGKRGIKICNEWLQDFMNFYNWAINSGYQDNLTIDRINVNGNYEPSNCRWATNKEQANNTRKSIYITYKNKTLTLSKWCELLNINYPKIYLRLKRYKWSIEKTFNTP